MCNKNTQWKIIYFLCECFKMHAYEYGTYYLRFRRDAHVILVQQYYQSPRCLAVPLCRPSYVLKLYKKKTTFVLGKFRVVCCRIERFVISLEIMFVAFDSAISTLNRKISVLTYCCAFVYCVSQ